MPASVHRKPPTSSRRPALLAVLALLSGVLVAGCGGGSKSPTGGAGRRSAATASEVESGVAFSRCIRANGVPSFPDPKVSGQAVRMGSASTLQSPAFRSAAHACQRLLPKGPPGAEPLSPQTQTRMLKLSECMREHGFSDFPDPSSSPPSSRAAYSAIVGRGGYYLAIPTSIDMSSPAFERAAATCNLR